MKKYSRLIIFPILFSLTVFIGSCNKEDRSEYTRSTAACARMASEGLLEVSEQRAKRFHGKVQEDTALCRGGDNAVKYRDVPWLDWANYWGAGMRVQWARTRRVQNILAPPDEELTVR